MSGRLSDIQNRIATTRQLDTVIGAMRGIAATRANDAQARLAGIRACAATVGRAIGAVLPLAPQGADELGRRTQQPPRIAIVLCTEQGFVGSFNAQTVARASACSDHARCEYLIVGSRGLPIARELGLPVVWWSPAASHVGDVDGLSGSLTDALYARLALHADSTVHVIHALPDTAQTVEIVERCLLPFDFARFTRDQERASPILHLPTRQLLTGLAETYIYTELCEAMMLSFAAENEARVQAMLAARSNVQDQLEHLVGEYRQLRQEEITSEIVELTAGNAAIGCTPANRRA